MMGLSDNVLHELAGAGRCVKLDELDARLSQHARRDIIKAVGGLIARKLVIRDYPGCYMATDAGREWVRSGKRIKSGPAGPHTGKQVRREDSFTARLWEALRAERKATTRELVALIRRDSDKQPEDTAARYLGRWARAGFITKLRSRLPGTSPTSNGYVKWFVTRDNGPNPPLWRASANLLVDGNTGEEFSVDGELRTQEGTSTGEERETREREAAK
jgi:hypothetical protein